MGRAKKIITSPKSLLGFNKDMKICYNCMFYSNEGRCPWDYNKGKYQYYDYNHRCSFPKLFRYNLLYKHYIE